MEKNLTSPDARKSIAVLGGGATGLAAAYRLVSLGHRVRLFELNTRLGGAVGSGHENGWLWEAGPNSFQENSKEIVALIGALGLASERIEASPTAKKRFIVRRGQLCAVPMSPGSLISTPLFSFRSKIRLLTEPFTRPRTRAADLSMANFVRSHFGDEIVDYALNPFVSGIYAGNAARLSARTAFPKVWQAEQTHGSLIRGMLSQAKSRRAAGEPKTRLISFRGGLQTLTDALAHTLPPGSVELGASVEALVDGPSWKVIWRREGETHTEEFCRVVLALPAGALAKLSFGSFGERPLAALEAVEYPPVASLFLGFRREDVPHPLDGFGALIPSSEPRNILGVLFSSSLFPGRAPEGQVALTVMAGGSFRPEMARLEYDALMAKVRPELRDLLGITAEPVFRRHQVWPKAIPQYNLGYDRFLDAITACERKYAGMLIGGHVRDGIALNSCILSGLSLGERAGR